jgi:hypothetical protein
MPEIMDEPAQDGKELDSSGGSIAAISRIIDKYFKYVTFIMYF